MSADLVVPAPAAPTAPDAVRLGPFQRAEQVAGAVHHLAVSTARASGPELVHAVLSVLHRTPALRAELVDVDAMRLPWQRLGPVRTRVADGPAEARWTVEAGDTRVEVAERDGSCTLEVRVPAVFADETSLIRFVELVDAEIAGTGTAGTGIDGTDAPEPFGVERAHLEMQHEGELDAEEQHWRARRAEVAATGPRLADVIAPEAATGPGRLPLEPATVARAAALAASVDGAVEDVAHLALRVVLDGLGVDPNRIERRVDARALMGLPDAIGALTHTVPAPGPATLDGTARAALAELVDRRRHEDDLVGGPASRAEGERAEVLLTTGAPPLPAGWRPGAYRPALAADVVGTVADDALVVEVTPADAADRPVPDPRVIVALWRSCLTSLVTTPDADVRALALTDEPARSALDRELTTARDRAPAPDVCRTVLEWATRDPDRPAVDGPTGRLTYGELLGRIGALVEQLGGVGPGDVVAVVSRSNRPELLVALLAVLWRGAAFVPVDPEEPPERIADALTRSAAALVLHAVPEDAPRTERPTLCVAAAASAPLPAVEVPAPVAVPDTIPAYLLRTSGSTGRPKFVVVARAALQNYLGWVRDLAATVIGDRLLPVTSPAVFDASFKQTLGMLHAGRTVWMSRADHRDVAALVADLAATGRGLAINCVPSFWSVVLETLPDEAVLPVDRVLLGGEAVTRSLLDQTWRRFPQAEVWNLYGPTEATATATMGRLTPSTPVHAGRPVAGAVVAVLDRHGRPLPARVVGEIAIAGPGVALGYRPASVDRSAFSPIPSTGDPVAAYRTGDHGLLDPDGHLHVRGRRDEQVKINGWRVELGEIETVAEQVTGVRRAVAAVEDGRVLRLYLTGTAPTDEVRARLAEVLPAPMVPSTVARVARIPTTVSGKADRAALLAQQTRSAEEDPTVYGPEQRLVAQAWRRLLDGGWPRVDDDFFASGGHSLLLAQLINVLRVEGFPNLSLRHVIRRPTVAAIAEQIRAHAEQAS